MDFRSVNIRAGKIAEGGDMKLGGDTAPTIFLELVAGLIFLSVIMVVASLAKTPPASVSKPHQTLKSTSVAAYSEKSALANPVDYILNTVLNQVMQRFQALDQKVDALVAVRDEHVFSKVNTVTAKVAELRQSQQKNILPGVNELQRKIDFITLEHERYITPTIAGLSDHLANLSSINGVGIPAIGGGAIVDEDSGSGATGYIAEPEPVLLEESSLDPETVEVAKQATIIKSDLSTAVDPPPVVRKMSNLELAKRLQKVLARYGIGSTIGLNNNGLLLEEFFDFDIGSSFLPKDKRAKLSILADALSEIFLCYANSTDILVMAKCQGRSNPVGVSSVIVKAFSIGDNVGTERFNYNWRLASARSIEVLKAVVTSRPDLLEFKNREGLIMLKAVAELAKSGSKRTRSIELQFVIDK
ncbi:MAG: hypothetical protein HQL70_01840 [Magnetococcales bacterium]|nr:hypothetical protein [Magnetococcales bacterium]